LAVPGGGEGGRLAARELEGDLGGRKVNATQNDAHERLVEEIVRGYFGALDTSGSLEGGGMGSQRDAVEGDLKSLTREELYFALTDTDRFLESVYDIAEQTNVVATAVISDAHNRVKAALERVERAGESQA
jgi:hypothetical protein